MGLGISSFKYVDCHAEGPGSCLVGGRLTLSPRLHWLPGFYTVKRTKLCFVQSGVSTAKIFGTRVMRVNRPVRNANPRETRSPKGLGPHLTPASATLSPVTFPVVFCPFPIGHGFLSHLPATPPSAFLLPASLRPLRYRPPQTFSHLSVRHLPVTFSPRIVTSSQVSPVTFSSSATLLLSPQCLSLSRQPPSRLLALIQPFSCHPPR